MTRIHPAAAVAGGKPTLVSELGELLHRLQARRRRLMAMRRESNARMADFAVADVSLFWLLNALNSAEPVLSELHQDPSRHPELLYRELAGLAGSLLTFSLNIIWKQSPLPACLARAGIPAAVCPAGYAARSPALKGDRHRSGAGRRPGDLAGQAARCAAARGADFYLSVRSSSPSPATGRFPQLCKAGSHDDVAEVVNIALSGIAIKPLSHVPAAIPLRLENQYFALDLSTDAARAMLEAGNCTFYSRNRLAT